MSDSSPMQTVSTDVRGFIEIAGPGALRTRYRVNPLCEPVRPVRGVLLDLDGTSLQSEEYWVSLLSKTLASINGSADGLTELDETRLRGGTTRAHLEYMHRTYRTSCSYGDLESAYWGIVEAEFFSASLDVLAEAFSIAPGFIEIRRNLLDAEIPLILVTNGNRRKAARELAVIARQLGLARAEDVCAGVFCTPDNVYRDGLRTIGCLPGKPHPWPYLEAAVDGLGLSHADLSSVVAVDDTVVGVASARIAGVVPFALDTQQAMGEAYDGLALRVLTHLNQLLDEL